MTPREQKWAVIGVIAALLNIADAIAGYMASGLITAVLAAFAIMVVGGLTEWKKRGRA